MSSDPTAIKPISYASIAQSAVGHQEMEKVDMSNPEERDKEQHDLESMASYGPPFLPAESLIDYVEMVHSDTPTSESSRNEQTTSSQLRLVLPAAFYSREQGFQEVIEPDHRTFNAYLSSELNISRLNAIQPHLWLAGLAKPARSLQEHVMLGRQIVVTEQTDLHMVWHGSKVYVKPLPEFLLCHSIWEQNLCQYPELYRCGLGILFSYIQLVRAKSDLRVAHSSGLLPDEISWEQWTRFCRVVHQKVSTQTIDPRYQYGELRLARLNWIYRFRGRIFRGYAPQESRGWLVGTLVYITIVLTAMQVGLATNNLSGNLAFQRASYGFTVFSIMGPVIILCAYWGGIALVILWNLLFMFRYIRRRKAEPKVENSWVNAASSGRTRIENERDLGSPPQPFPRASFPESLKVGHHLLLSDTASPES